MQDYTIRLARFIADAQPDEHLMPLMKNCMLDTLGCAVAGSQRAEIRAMHDALCDSGETGSAGAWMTGENMPMSSALVYNASMSHAVELDDLHKPSKVHPGTVIVPLVLTLGANMHASGRDVLAAMLIGYETMIRVAEGIGVDSHRRRGWHGTATCGSFGAAAAAGRLMGLDGDALANALGLAGTATGGLMAYTADGSMSKRYHAGKAAENGYMAAKLASRGFTGPKYVLEASDGGYAKAASDAYDLGRITNALGTDWRSAKVGHKFYACCGHIHQAIECAISLKNDYGIAPGDIDSAVIRTYDVSGLSWGFDKQPANTVEAQFSFQFAVASALMTGSAFLPQFAPERLSDPQVNSLARKIAVRTDAGYTARYPAEWCSALEVHLADGRTLCREAVGAKGDPQKPLTEREVDSKFAALCDGIMPPDRQRAIIDSVRHIDELPDVSELTRLLRI